MSKVYADGNVTCELRDGRIALIGLNDEERLNPFTTSVSFGLDEAVQDSLDADHTQIIFFGRGRSFSAGADMDAFRETVDGVTNGTGFDHFYRSERALIRLAQNLRLPHVTSVSAVHGWVIGQGVELAISCDFIVAEEGARFWMPETQVGWNAGMGTAQLLINTVGLGWAKRILLLNERIDAETAETLGMVARIATTGSHIDTAIALLQQLSRSAPRALQFQKKIIDMAPSMSLDDSRELEVITGHWLAHTHDVREAAEAFVAKRDAAFRGY